jgi:hypothetical protein
LPILKKKLSGNCPRLKNSWLRHCDKDFRLFDDDEFRYITTNISHRILVFFPETLKAHLKLLIPGLKHINASRESKFVET